MPGTDRVGAGSAWRAAPPATSSSTTHRAPAGGPAAAATARALKDADCAIAATPLTDTSRPARTSFVTATASTTGACGRSSPRVPPRRRSSARSMCRRSARQAADDAWLVGAVGPVRVVVMTATSSSTTRADLEIAEHLLLARLSHPPAPNNSAPERFAQSHARPRRPLPRRPASAARSPTASPAHLRLAPRCSTSSTVSGAATRSTTSTTTTASCAETDLKLGSRSTSCRARGPHRRRSSITADRLRGSLRSTSCATTRSTRLLDRIPASTPTMARYFDTLAE